MSHQVLKLREVSSVTKLSSSTIYRLIKSGDFPRPIKLATHASGWLAAEIDRWLEDRQKVVHVSRAVE